MYLFFDTETTALPGSWKAPATDLYNWPRLVQLAFLLYDSNGNKICTMEKTTIFCAIDGPYGYKWPKLSELYYKLFRTGFKEAHNAAIDITATAKCFWELKRLGKI